jgi:uncharacterized membrane protein required for colicin V production
MIVIIGAYWGSTRGLLAELIALVGVFVGILSASRFYLKAVDALLPVLRDQEITTFIAFLVIYVLSVLSFFLIYLLIKSNMAGGAITPASRLFAALVGGLKSAVFIAMVLLLVIFLWGPDNAFTSGSKMLPKIMPHCQPVLTLLPETMREPLGEYLDGLKPAQESSEENKGE